MSRARLPSPLAQNVIFLNLDRFAGCIGCAPGMNIAPAQGAANAATTSPLTRSECVLPFAPSSATASCTVDLPPAIESVDSVQADPNFALALPSSKLLIA